MAIIPDMPIKSYELATFKQLKLISWLARCRGIHFTSRYGTTSPGDLTKRQASRVINGLFSNISNDGAIRIIEQNGMIITGLRETKRTWQELMVEDMLRRWG